jgi:hypothetical protein
MLTNPPARRFSIPPFRGEIAAAYDTPEMRGLLAALDVHRAAPGAAVLHATRNTVWVAGPVASFGQPVEVAVKEFGLRGLNRLKTLFVASKARRAWNGARALQAAGLATAVPIAFGEERRRGLAVRAVFLAERLDGGTELRELLRGRPAAELQPLLAALAGFVRQGHDLGVVHRDLSDGNVLVLGPEAPRFFLLDTNRVRRRRRLGTFARAKSLIRLGIPVDLRRGFLDAYAGEGGARPFFLFLYVRTKALFEGWLRFKKKAHLRRWARRLKIQ